MGSSLSPEILVYLAVSWSIVKITLVLLRLKLCLLLQSAAQLIRWLVYMLLYVFFLIQRFCACLVDWLLLLDIGSVGHCFSWSMWSWALLPVWKQPPYFLLLTNFTRFFYCIYIISNWNTQKIVMPCDEINMFAFAGCCFVKYATSEEAERAIRALHNQWTIPGVTSFCWPSV
jgi:hypothetical protein